MSPLSGLRQNRDRTPGRKQRQARSKRAGGASAGTNTNSRPRWTFRDWPLAPAEPPWPRRAAVFLPKLNCTGTRRAALSVPMYSSARRKGSHRDDESPCSHGDRWGPLHNRRTRNMRSCKGGQARPENGEIAFIAITPRNLRRGHQAVPTDSQGGYRRVVGWTHIRV